MMYLLFILLDYSLVVCYFFKNMNLSKEETS